MPDTVRTRGQLEALLADNVTGNISPQDVRDFLKSITLINEDALPADDVTYSIGSNSLRWLAMNATEFVAGDNATDWADLLGASLTFYGTGAALLLNLVPSDGLYLVSADQAQASEYVIDHISLQQTDGSALFDLEDGLMTLTSEAGVQVSEYGIGHIKLQGAAGDLFFDVDGPDRSGARGFGLWQAGTFAEALFDFHMVAGEPNLNLYDTDNNARVNLYTQGPQFGALEMQDADGEIRIDIFYGPDNVGEISLVDVDGLYRSSASYDATSTHFQVVQPAFTGSEAGILANVLAADLKLFLQGLPATDPAVAGQLYTMDSAGLAAELAAGSRYVLISDGP